MEPEWVSTIGYRHLVSTKENKLDFYLGGSFKFPPLLVEKGVLRLNLTQGLTHIISSNWSGLMTNDFYMANSTDRAGKILGLGFDLMGALVYKGKKNWSKGLVFGWQQTLLSHITHSEATKNTFIERYPNADYSKGPKDGWYKHTASRLRLGYQTGKEINKNSSIELGFGALLSLQKQGVVLSFAHGQVPLFLSVIWQQRLKK
jgi:hypothetical protein